MSAVFFYVLTHEGQPRGLVVRRGGDDRIWNWDKGAWQPTSLIPGLSGLLDESEQVDVVHAQEVARNLGIPWTWEQSYLSDEELAKLSPLGLRELGYDDLAERAWKLRLAAFRKEHPDQPPKPWLHKK